MKISPYKQHNTYEAITITKQRLHGISRMVYDLYVEYGGPSSWNQIIHNIEGNFDFITD